MDAARGKFTRCSPTDCRPTDDSLSIIQCVTEILALACTSKHLLEEEESINQSII